MGRLKTTTNVRTRVGLKTRQVVYAASGLSLALLIGFGSYLYLNLKSGKSKADESKFMFTYSFGEGEGVFKSESSAHFLPAPQSGKARVYVAGSKGSIALVNEGETDLGAGSELKIEPSQSYSAINKFSVYDYEPGSSFYTKFSMKLSGYFGVYYFIQGKGASFSNNHEYNENETFAGLKFTNILGYVVVSHLKNNKWELIGDFSLETGKVYEFELYGNNHKGNIPYDRPGNAACQTYSVSKGKFDLWVNDELIGDDLNGGKISNKSEIDSWMFYGNGDLTNTAALHLDDIVYGNQIVPGITPVENQPENIVFSVVAQTAFHVSFDQAHGMPDGYIAIRKEGSAPAQGPTDYTNYTVGQALGDGIVAYIGPDKSFEESNLNAGTTYFYRIYSYQGGGSCKNYYPVSPLEGAQSTLFDPAFALFRTSGNGAWSNPQIWEKEISPDVFIKANATPGLAHKVVIKSNHKVSAERLTVNNLKIEKGAELTIEKELIVNDGKAPVDFSNSGRLNLNGRITANGAIKSEPGSTVAFHSGAATVPGGAYHHVVINGSTKKQLAGNITIAGELAVNEGILNTGEDTVFLRGGRIKETAEGFVLGTVALDTTIAGATVEAAGLGVLIDAAANNQNLGKVRVVRITGKTCSIGESQSINRLWRIHPEFEPVREVSVSFSWNEADEHENLNLAQMQVWKSEDEGLSWQQVGKVSDGAARRLTVATSSFSDWTVGNASSALPVTFIEFKAEQRNAQTILRWATAVEINNSGFEVERSFDARSFEKIGFVEGNLNTHKVMYYEFAAPASPQTAYYRLKQIDIDGRYDFSDIIAVGVSATLQDQLNKQELFTIYPNPISDRSVISVSSGFDRLETLALAVYNIQGRQVINERGTIDEINDRLSYKIQVLNKGQYILHITHQNRIEKINVIKR